MADEEKGVARSELVMPPIEAGEHLIDYLFKVGPSAAGETLTFQELAAWCAMTGHHLTAWEAATLRQLSGAYLGEYEAAANAKRPAPYQTAERVISREEVSNRILAAFKQLAGGDGATDDE